MDLQATLCLMQVFDKDGSGTLSTEELREIMTEKGQMRLTHEEVDEMISEVDRCQNNNNIGADGDNDSEILLFHRDKDGKLNYAEFVRIFSS